MYLKNLHINIIRHQGSATIVLGASLQIAFRWCFFERGLSENYRTISISVRCIAPAMQSRPRLCALGGNINHPREKSWICRSDLKFRRRSISVLSIGTLVSHTRKSRQPAICRPINGFVARARSLSPGIINIPRRGSGGGRASGMEDGGWNESEIPERAQLASCDRDRL